MARARLVTLPGAGHLLHEEAAASSLPVLREFLLAPGEPAPQSDR